MNKLDSSSVSLIYPGASHFESGTAHRLIVLIPTDSNHTFATHRITDLAHTSGAQVLFLGLCKDAAQELSLRRQIITHAALLEEARVCVESKVEIGTNWVDVVKTNYREGDMIICFREQQAGLFQKPLRQILKADLSAPVYILSDISPESHSRSNLPSKIIVWTGSIGVIAAAFLIQVQIFSMPRDWAQTALLILSVLAEAWLIGVWNSLFG